MMDTLHVQREIEKHKMTILFGLTNLKRAELSSCEYVLDTLYDVLGTKI
jgi:hypothetical protein